MTIRNDEELMLLASRRKLLARTDWLALEPTRPLHLSFPAHSNNDRVGRRKKIKRESARASKPAQQRPFTPLFEERLHTNNYMMSGALPPSSEGKIEIKVGTDAFNSQTCPRSHMSRNASVGSQSTALSRLSEESMLLGVDGDSFDADLVEVQPFHVCREESGEPFDHRYHTPLVGRSTQATRGHSPAYINQTELQQHAVSPLGESSIATAEQYQRIYRSNNDDLMEAHLREQDRRVITPAGGTDSSNEMLEFNHLDAQSPANPSEPDMDAEAAWKRLMGIATQVASSASIQALNSMSEHVTASESTSTANSERVKPLGVAVSTPRGNRSNSSEGDLERGLKPSVGSHYAAEPLAATEQSPARPSEHLPQDEDGESLWRDFIIGSQGSESENENELHSAWQRKRKRRMSSSDQSQNLVLSGLGTSDKATQGGGTVALSTSSLVAIADTNESHRLHSSESIDELSLDYTPDSKRPRNFHAFSTHRKSSKPLKRFYRR